MNTSTTLYTIGHSDRDIGDFVSLLNRFGIKVLVDIRAYPNSGRFPHFSESTLRNHIENAGIDYHWAGRQLGGMRKPLKADSHPALPRESFRGFAEYMETPYFKRVAGRLQSLAAKAPTAIMCAEKQANGCHRSLISDYLVFKNLAVKHIIDQTTVADHCLSILARTDSAELVYDLHISGSLSFE